MSSEIIDTVPEEGKNIESVVKAFATWRAARRRGEHIPKALWEKAVALHPAFSVHQISRTLGLDFVGLRDRISGEHRESEHHGDEGSPFIDLGSLRSPSKAEPRWKGLSLRLRSADGTRMRVSVRGAGAAIIADVLRVLSGRR